jgi:Sec-independent protein translocase protein TatA
MFGFGFWEIAILIGLLVLVFGAKRLPEILRRGVEIHGKVNQTKQEVRSLFSLDGLLGRDRDKKP